MNYKEALFFVGKCLTINSERHNFEIVKRKLENGVVDLDAIVKLSTSHYVFPALYCNLKKAKLLKLLPTDLVDFMQHINQLNLVRNEQIISQVKEINTLLIKNNITPIFLKGVGNIFQDLYNDISERMIADIDFVIAKEDYLKTIDLIHKLGYSKVDKSKNHSPLFKHHPRLQKEGYVAAVEIHREILIDKFSDEFNYDVIKNNCITVNGITVSSYNNQLSLSILSNQINDDGFYIKNLTLKHAYDVYLFSKKTNPKQAFQKFHNLKYPLNCFLASCYHTFNKVESLKYETSPETEKYLQDFNTYLVDHKKRKRDYRIIKIKLYLIRKKHLFRNAIFHREYRKWFLKDILNKLKFRKLAS